MAHELNEQNIKILQDIIDELTDENDQLRQDYDSIAAELDNVQDAYDDSCGRAVRLTDMLTTAVSMIELSLTDDAIAMSFAAEAQDLLAAE